MAPLPVVTFVLGGWDLGTHADLILQGLLFAQFTKYWAQYKTDYFPYKVFVVCLCVATTIKSAHAITLVWFQNVEYFADFHRAGMIFAQPSLGVMSFLLMALITVYIQIFFLHRLWLLSRNIYIVSCISLLFVLCAIAAIVTMIYSYIGTIQDDEDSISTSRNSIWVLVQNAAVVAGDVLLCGSTIYFLLKQSKDALPETVSILNRLMKVTFQTAAPAALCATLTLICKIYYNPQRNVDLGFLFLFIGTMTSPKLYAISAMWTLNSRRGIRSHFSDVIHSSSQIGTGPGVTTTIQFRAGSFTSH